MSLSREPWVNEDGSTNVPAFLAAYKADDNVFWATDIGHVQNVLDDRIDALGEAEATITGLREALADLFARADATPLETPVGIFFAASREAMAARARARPEFPDTEGSDGR